MLYQFFRPFAKIVLGSYFKKIYLTNVENIPLDKPVILACNHPTAFVEPCILACWLPKSLNFLARGDFFLKPVIPYFLRAVHIIPIFRLRDGGFGKLKNNFNSFKECYQAFSKNKLILIMSEGGTLHEKRLRPIQKGTARLAIGALGDNPDLELQIIPVGVNFTKSEDFRSRVMIDFGKPIRAKDFLPIYKENNAKGIKALTQKIEDEMGEIIIHLPNDERESLIDFVLSLVEGSIKEKAFPVVENNGALLKQQLRVVQKINQLSEGEDSIFFKKVAALKSEFKSLDINELFFNTSPTSPLKKIILMLLSPIFIIGFLLNIFPMLTSDKLAKSIFPTDLTFQTPFKIVINLVIYPAWLVIVGLVIVLTKSGLSLWSLLIIPMSGVFALFYFDEIQNWVAGRKLEKISKEKLVQIRRRWESIAKVWA